MDISKLSIGSNRKIQGEKFDNTSTNTSSKDNLISTDTKLLMEFESLDLILGLPPVSNNIVDPPVFINKNDYNQRLVPFSKYIGRDYVDTVLRKGQYVVLVPLNLIPNIPRELAANTIGAAVDTAFNIITLDKLQNRLDVTAYAYRTEIAGAKYERAVKALIMCIGISLGIDMGPEAANNTDLLKYLPTRIADALIKNSGGVDSRALDFFPSVFEKQESDENFYRALSKRENNETSDSQFTQWLKKRENDKKEKVNELNKDKIELGKVNQTNFIDTGIGEDSLKLKTDYNILKFVTNTTSNEDLNMKLPWVIFYANGPIEQQYNVNQDLSESALAKSTVDLGAQLVKSTTLGQEMQPYLQELAYHHQGMLGNVADLLIENTAIPRVLKSSMMDYTFTWSVKTSATGSDVFSVFKVLTTLAYAIPFVTPVNANSNRVIPESALYCAAFSKGTMNVPRGAITSLSIKTDPLFQTSSGVPMDMEIQFTLQPMMTVGTMPDFGSIFNNTPTQYQVIAAMFNPLSAFNMLATLAGQNTVLTEFPMGLFEFFIKGKINSFWEKLKGVKNYMGDMIYDWNAEDTARFARITASRG